MLSSSKTFKLTIKIPFDWFLLNFLHAHNKKLLFVNLIKAILLSLRLKEKSGTVYSILKLFKIREGKQLGIRYIQDLENIDNSFRGFELPVNNIIQIKDSGKIVVTTIDGRIYLFSKPNLDFYFKAQKG